MNDSLARVVEPASDATNDATLAAAPGSTPRLVDPGPAGPLAPGAAVGRYLVLARLGAGGMGVVYAAYDPELDRKVALKLVLHERAGSRARMLREAQALARLQHPNIVAVHDVGVLGEQVWLAMEFVDGLTFQAWLKSQHRSSREVVEAMRAVARGLAAVHAAGLVHRDVKPDNIMVGSDGRVRVMDFGLVRSGGDAGEVEPREAGQPSQAALTSALTEAGSVLGTPAYMAPEQFLGQTVDARADQFSWCVTCWEALYGERPFAATDFAALALAVTGGELRAPPPGHDVPPWLRRTLTRGLQADPARRFPTMTALLDALQQGRAGARRRRVFAVAGAALLAGGGAFAAAHLQRERAIEACTEVAASVREVWNPERRAAIAAAFAGSGLPHAASSLDRVAARLDAYADEWQRRRAESCVRAEVEGAAPLAQATVACLAERRAALQGLVEQLAVADEGVVTLATQAAWNLPSLAACGDEVQLARSARPLAELADHVELATLQQELARVGALTAVGKLAEAAAHAGRVRARAAAFGHVPLIVEVAIAESSARERLGEVAAAEVILEQAFYRSFGAGLDDQVARIAARLVFTVGYRQQRFDEAMQWGALASAALDRVGGDASIRGTLLAALGATHGQALHGDAEIRLSEQALALVEEALGPDHPNVGVFASNLGQSYIEAGDLDAAEDRLDLALSLLEPALGPDHYATGIARFNRGLLDLRRGDYGSASEHFETARASLVSAYGPTHLEAAFAGILSAGAFIRLGELDEAQRRLDAVASRDPTITGASLQTQARLHAADDDLERALQVGARALGRADDDPSLESEVLVDLGDVHLRRAELPEARARFARAVALTEPGRGPAGPVLAEALTGLGEAELGLGRPDAATAAIERAHALLSSRPGEPRALARTAFALARARWAEGRPREAQALAREAWTRLRDSEGDHARAEQEIARWLATRGGL